MHGRKNIKQLHNFVISMRISEHIALFNCMEFKNIYTILRICFERYLNLLRLQLVCVFKKNSAHCIFKICRSHKFYFLVWYIGISYKLIPKFFFLKSDSDSTMVKGKGIPRQAEVAQGVPGRLSPRIFSTFSTTRVVGRQPKAPATFTPG